MNHIHSPACTVESCGAETIYFCPDRVVCQRAVAAGSSALCVGHPVPSRAQLVDATLARKGLLRSRGVAPSEAAFDPKERQEPLL